MIDTNWITIYGKSSCTPNNVAVACSGNCNFSYITGLMSYKQQGWSGVLMLQHTLTQPRATAVNSWGKPVTNKPVGPVYRSPTCGMYLFAQDSENKPADMPYAHNFKAAIESEGLGTVVELPPVPNILHGGKTGILFVWIIDHAACNAWWHKNVQQVWLEQQKESTTTLADKAKKELEGV